MDNYANLVEKIARHSGISAQEIDKKVEAKKSKLSGLISKEGAAQRSPAPDPPSARAAAVPLCVGETAAAGAGR